MTVTRPTSKDSLWLPGTCELGDLPRAPRVHSPLHWPPGEAGEMDWTRLLPLQQTLGTGSSLIYFLVSAQMMIEGDGKVP